MKYIYLDISLDIYLYFGILSSQNCYTLKVHEQNTLLHFHKFRNKKKIKHEY